jgi:hypothetical protein
MYFGKEMIADPAAWLKEYRGPYFVPVDRHVITGYPRLQMKDVPEHKLHCSLTALTSVFLYYARLGYDRLPDRQDYLFRRIRSLAYHRGIYLSPLFGTIPFLIDRLAKATWKYYGYPQASAKNRLFWQSGRQARQPVSAELQADRPLLLSLASGYYRKHTVTVYGYERYVSEEDPSEERIFLLVNDHWTEAARYVELLSLDPFYGGSCFEFCFITPPQLPAD